MHSRLPKELSRFIAESVSELPDQVRDHQKYDMRLRVYLELVKNPASGLPIQFVRAADMTPQQKELVRSSGMVIVREQQRDVSNRGWLKPRHVVKAVAAQIPFKCRRHLNFDPLAAGKPRG
jgi:hypothetical protein